MAHFENRRGRVVAHVALNGKRQAKTFDTKKEAQTWAIHIEAGLADKREREIITDAQGIYTPNNFAEILQRYECKITSKKRSPDNERIIIKYLLENAPFMDLPIRDVDERDFDDFAESLLERIKPSTASRYFDVLRHAAKIAHKKWKWVSPYEAICTVKFESTPPAPIARVTDGILQRLYDNCLSASRTLYLMPLIKVAVGTALRRSELSVLVWEWIDFDKKCIFLNKTKNGYSRKIPMTEDVERQLRILWSASETRTGPVFQVTTNAIKMAFQRLQRRAGTGIRFHDLRHEGISRLFELGLTPIEVAHISGHRTMSQLMRYSHADTDNLLAKLRGLS
tara:strand:+ start:584 stop:1597 length:1014 start_codon:yes stop_codon:yes gene_type:complete